MTTWSNKLPTEKSGYYWWRCNEQTPEYLYSTHCLLPSGNWECVVEGEYRILTDDEARALGGEWLRIPSPTEVAALEKDAERFRYCVEYNWIAASIRVKHRIQDGDIDSARAAIDSAIEGEQR